MALTYHSEYLTLESVYLNSVANSWQNQGQLDIQWQELNYLRRPLFQQALKEYEQFETIFSKKGVLVHHFPQDDEVKIDSIYCRDASITTDFGVIICNMGKGGRLDEPKLHLDVYKNAGKQILGLISSPGTLEGGDVAWLDRKTLAVGHTYRTNKDGIAQLKSLLEPKGIEVLVAEMPHYKGTLDVFHLMSVFSPVDKDLAVVYSPLMPIGFRNELLYRNFRLVEVPEEEFESLGCNVLAIGPSDCIMVRGNPKTQRALEDVGCKVSVYDGEQISAPGGGGPTCLTRPLLRSY
ncbi:MAG: arginine deiminase family protein [Bacteroidota bacterium]